MNIIKSITLTLIFLAILFHAAFSGMDKVAQRRESRSILVNLANGQTLVWEAA